MAFSISIDAKFWDDPRYLHLKSEIGQQKALWGCVEAWRLARAFWLRDQRPIPDKLWRSLKLPEALIINDLAVRQEDGVYVRGTRDRARRYELCIAAGIKGAEIREGRKLNDIKQTASGSDTGSLEGRVQASYSYSYFNNKKQEIPEKKSVVETQPPPVGFQITPDAIARCCEVWKESLVALGQDRAVTPAEVQVIGWSLQEQKDLKIVLEALEGARHEPSSPSYNPRNYVDITRILLKDQKGRPRIHRAVGWGAAKKKPQWKGRRDAISENE